MNHLRRFGSCAPLTGRGLVVLAFVALLATAAACSSSPSNETFIRDRIGLVWDAAGVDSADVQILGYARYDRPRAPACAGLAQDQRWWGKQTSTIPPDLIDQATMLERLTVKLAGEGYDIRRYKSSGSSTRILDAVNDDDGVYIQIFVTGGGSASLDVKAGPCAVRLRGAPPPPYVRE